MDVMEEMGYESRTRRLIGDAALARLNRAHVVVVGLGGVGGYAVEMLARSGVGHLTIIDADCVEPSNLNRQIIALRSTVGMPKCELFAQRIADIDPAIEVHAIQEFLTEENVGELVPGDADFVIDAIDTVAPKVSLIAHCTRGRLPIVSSMGAGGRTDVSKVCYRSLWETADDGLARAVRVRLKKMGMRPALRVVCSTEPPHSASLIELDGRNKRSSFGTTAPVPSTFGIFLGAYVLRKLSEI